MVEGVEKQIGAGFPPPSHPQHLPPTRGGRFFHTLKLPLALYLALLGLFVRPAVPGVEGQQSSFIIVLVEQPASSLARSGQGSPGAPYREQLAELQAQARAIMAERAPPGPLAEVQAERAWSLTLAPFARQELAALQASADHTLHAMRQAILDAAVPALVRTQAPVVAAVRLAGGELLYRYRVVNALTARLPIHAVPLLESRPDVAAIFPDRQILADLDTSALALGANAWWENDQTGGVYDVGVIDSGVDGQHPAFGDHVIIEDWFLTAAGEPLWDAHPGDVNGHGSNVAGIISSGDDTYRGVAFGHEILFNLKAGYDLDGKDGGGAGMYWSDAMAAVDWAYTTHPDGPDVLNLSYGRCAVSGDSPFSRFWDAVVDELSTSVAIAAGNDGFACIHEPSIAYNVLSVANVDDHNTVTRLDDTIYWNSSRGPAPDGRRKPDLAAPGASILSANNSWDDGDGLWDAYWGTSQAAPHVAGSLLLMLDAALFEPQAQKALLINTAEDRGDPGWDARWGWGYIDLGHAYFHRRDVLDRTILPAPDYDLYVGSFFAGDKATLVWNRHVEYGGADYPTLTGTHALSDLDLYLYDAASNALVDSSVSVLDNVEQVAVTSSFTGVVRVQAALSAFDRVPFERYSLATEEGFREADGLRLITDEERTFYGPAGRPIRVSFTVTNSGDLPIHAVSATPVLPSGVVLVQGTIPTALGTLAADGSSDVAWSLQVVDGMTHTVPISLQGMGYGLAAFAGTAAVLVELPPAVFVPLVIRVGD